MANSNLDNACSVLEFGCGTGRFAVELLQHHLPAGAQYLGTDISSTMVELAAGRLEPFAARARVALVEGEPALQVEDSSVDRFISTYVFDLLPASEQRQMLAEAARVLREDGLLCLAGVTPGVTVASRAVMGIWQWLFERNPRWVGGCRPVRMSQDLAAHAWRVRHRSVVISWGVASEVVVATPRSEATHA